MTLIITDAATRARLLELNDHLTTATMAAAAAQAEVDEAAGRARALRGSIAEHRASEPAGDPDVSAELSVLLAADPQAAASTDWAGKLRDAQDVQAKALTAWNGKRTILDQALAQVEAELVERQAVFERANAARGYAFNAFAAEARVAMLKEMKPRWAAFVRDTIVPMEAFGRYGTSGPRSAVYFSENGVAIWQGPNAAVDTWLYRTGEMMPGAAGEVIQDFRAALAAEATPRARR